jgi:hypothetical protein
MCVQIAEKAVTAPGVFCETTTGLPALFAATEPPTGTSESFTSAAAPPEPPPADELAELAPDDGDPDEEDLLPELQPAKPINPTPSTLAPLAPKTERRVQPSPVMSVSHRIEIHDTAYGLERQTVQLVGDGRPS